MELRAVSSRLPPPSSTTSAYCSPSAAEPLPMPFGGKFCLAVISQHLYTFIIPPLAFEMILSFLAVYRLLKVRKSLAQPMRLDGEGKAGKSDLEALSFLIPDSAEPELTKTMVFFDDINLALQALRWLRKHLPPHLRKQVAVYNSRRSSRSKKQILQKFRDGHIKILLTTEAAGMGCDISDIVQVVQFMVPKSMSIWMQRAGRAGRSSALSARAILLVQPTVFQEVKQTTKSRKPTARANQPDEPDSIYYKKTVEDGLRDWINAKGCRRDVADEYFGDGTQRRAPTSFCCDNCLRESFPHHPLLDLISKKQPLTRPSSPSSDVEDTPSQNPDENGKRTMGEAANVANRRDEALNGAKSLLTTWRQETWTSQYSERPWGVQALMSDTIITSLAHKARLRSTDDLVGIGWSPLHVRRHGADVLSLLADFDNAYKLQKDADIKARAAQRKLETAAKAKAKKEQGVQERMRQKELKAALPKPARVSRAKKAPNVMGHHFNQQHSPVQQHSRAAPGSENCPPVTMPITPTPTPHNYYLNYHSPIPIQYSPTAYIPTNYTHAQARLPPTTTYSPTVNPFYIPPNYNESLHAQPPVPGTPLPASHLHSFNPFYQYYPPN
ncbi:hypothetical protein D9613_012919 [Agrocybe pediades]|uniref:DNA 3'-5' helicase n=1 Tax=Agrocybe pediades TaxID=84607 RepID=A0A8H4QEF8_9AGAR|nr:hypothetical protein D9613_012919 [Agrocybe pediades]